MNHTPQIAIAPSFLEALGRLPKAQEKKARDFLHKFQQNPLHNSINYEAIHGMRDPKVRTVRIDQAYRAIVVHPPKGDVYLLVWVDHHDEAMDWAKNKVFEVNPVMGALQVYDVIPVAKAASDRPPSIKGRHQKYLFDERTDDDLLLCGVPQALLPAVRAVITEKDLDALSPHLPSEAADALTMLAAGSSLEEALAEAGAAQSGRRPKIDPQNFAAALAQPASKRRFVVVESELQLQKMLEAPLEQWRVFLHPSQRALVEMRAKGPVCVRGGPGTGKTVVAIHRARHLATKVFTAPEDRILFTTYTKNLAQDIDRQLRAICGQERDRIEVTNLHQWAHAFLRGRGVKVAIAGAAVAREAWAGVFRRVGALPFPQAFYRDEWKHVVQAGEVTTKDEYLKAKRSGRGTPLSRAQRLDVWTVLAAYRAALDAASMMEFADMVREARKYLERAENRHAVHYRAVVADEIQDFSPGDLRLLRALVAPGESDLFLVGDAHQRIYGPAATLSACGIDARGRSKQLKLNYRTTREIRDWAVALMGEEPIDDLDDGRDTLKGYRSLRNGEPPVCRHFAKPADEQAFLLETVRAWSASGTAEQISVVARTNDQVERYADTLREAGIVCSIVDTDHDDAGRPGVRVATMHRVKGLEFPRVLIAGVQDGSVPLPVSGLGDEASRDDHEAQERRLLFVAATRARDELVITGSGKASRFVSGSS